MAWEYLEMPESSLLPACPRCQNRGHVQMIAPGVFGCGDCWGRRQDCLFRARFVGERPRAVRQPKARAS